MSILNLTPTPATPEQLAAGVFELPPALRPELLDLLTSAAVPADDELAFRAEQIALLAALMASPEDRAAESDGDLDPTDPGTYADAAMIGDPAWLLVPLASELLRMGITPLVSFQAPGQRAPVHAGFVPATPLGD